VLGRTKERVMDEQSETEHYLQAVGFKTNPASKSLLCLITSEWNMLNIAAM
jgi:hypothetical protein